MSTALVTGASAGIGSAFAHELAARGTDLVLVARDRARLDALATRLEATFGVRTEVIVADLADRAALDAVARRVSGEGPTGEIDLLVGNAGFGFSTPFLDTPVADEERALDVLCGAVLVLSHAAGRAMRERGRGGIVNVSSVASFFPGGAYSAAKAWVTTFTAGLASELRPCGVHVTALCPGLTRTEFHRRADMDTSRMPRWMWLDADDVVREGLDDLRRGKAISVPGRQYKAMVGALEVLPGGLLRRVAEASGRAR